MYTKFWMIEIFKPFNAWDLFFFFKFTAKFLWGTQIKNPLKFLKNLYFSLSYVTFCVFTPNYLGTAHNQPQVLNSHFMIYFNPIYYLIEAGWKIQCFLVHIYSLHAFIQKNFLLKLSFSTFFALDDAILNLWKNGA